MPTLCSSKVWQVLRHFVYYFFNLGTPKTVISNIATTRQISTPCSSLYDYPDNVPVGQKSQGQNIPMTKKCINSFLGHKLSHDRWL